MNELRFHGRVLCLLFGCGILASLTSASFGQVPNEGGFFRLTTHESNPRGLFLDTAGGFAGISLRPGNNGDAQAWRIVPVDAGVVRLQGIQRGVAESLVATNPRGPVTLAPIGQRLGELWRILPATDLGDVVSFESIAFPGRALSGHQDGQVSLDVAMNSLAQSWLLVPFNPPAALLPAFPAITRRVEPNPPLPPAEVELLNTTRREMLVLLADRRTAKRPRTIRIPAGAAERVVLDRDSGARIVEAHELRTIAGTIARQEFALQIPPRSFYDLSVYELSLKSIAIDRTGKSPNVIEDINYQPKSIGWYLLAAGSDLRSGPQDVFELARRENNPGAVRRLDPRELAPASDRPDVLERVLDSVRPK